MIFTLRAKAHSLSGKIELPASKSISNRILLIRALSKHTFNIENLSTADDTLIMQRALDRMDRITDVGPAGTAMRFLTAYYACTPGERILTGNERMKQRPISMLVDALRQLGAKIHYLEREGYPPLHIEGRRLNGGRVHIAGDISSQFISALMMIAPGLPEPLEILIDGDPLSKHYLNMTAEIMRMCGIKLQVNKNHILIRPGRYKSTLFEVERDWSAAAFWMAFAVASRKSRLLLTGLSDNSIQGDRASLELFQHFGVIGTFTESGLEISKTDRFESVSGWNFRNHPDLVQPAVVASAILGQNFHFEGLDNLRLKETDRIRALQSELEKIGVNTAVKGHRLSIKPSQLCPPTQPFDSHDDHRMVMALTPLCLCFPEIIIRDPMVVAKSYPGFWRQVEKFADIKPSGR